MRVRPDYVRVHEGRTESLAGISGGALERRVAGHGIGAVHFFEMEIGESGDEARNAAACGLHFYRNGDRIAVVFDAKDDGELAEGGGVHRLPEFAFARSAVTEGDVGDFIILDSNVLKAALIDILGWRRLDGLRMARKIASAPGTTHCLQNLRAGRRRLRNDMQRGIAPVRGHL